MNFTRDITPDERQVAPATPAPLTLLASRYIVGEISDAPWMSMMSLLDDSDTTAEERLALANFLNDAFSDLGPTAVKVPALVEVDELVALLRAA